MGERDKLAREPLMKVPEVAEYLGLAESTVRNKVQAGEIPYKKVGRSVRFRRAEIDAWIEEQSGNGSGT